MAITAMEMSVRMAASVVLGAAVGYQRERAGRPAGLRTHLLVSLASATFMLVSSQFVYFQHFDKDDLVVVDASRIAASVVSGVGFLGAGAILRTGLTIQGLTTAASLWLVAAVGLASGAGMFVVAVAATCVALLSLVLLRKVEDKQFHLIRRSLRISMEEAEPGAKRVEQNISALGGVIRSVDYEHDLVEKRVDVALELSFRDAEAEQRVITALEAMPGIRRVKIARPA